MRRFFVTPEELKNPTVLLKDEEFHHLKNVCRLTEGERLELLDGKGKIADATIKSIGKKSAEIHVDSVRQLDPPQKPYIEIVLSLPRFQKMDEIIQKCVELGVTKLTPVFSERSFVKKKSTDLDGKIARWNKISLEACKQSGNAWPLQIPQPQNLADTLKEKRTSLFLYEGQGTLSLKEALGNLTEPTEIRVYIGSEGGFSPSEVKEFQARGLQPVTMGDLVLRVETACITVVSVIKYQFNLLG